MLSFISSQFFNKLTSMKKEAFVCTRSGRCLHNAFCLFWQKIRSTASVILYRFLLPYSCNGKSLLFSQTFKSYQNKTWRRLVVKQRYRISRRAMHDGRLLYMQFAPGVKLRLLLVSGLLAAILCVVKIPHL